MRVVSFLNLKGGVGKTSGVHHLAGTLAASGRKVLLVDCDFQASLTQGFFGPREVESADPDATFAAILAGDMPAPELVIRPTPIAGISIVPGHIVAGDYNHPVPYSRDYPEQTRLRDFLESVERDMPGAFDLVLSDCHPDLQLATWNALAASTHVVVPLQAEDYGVQGMGPVQRSLDMVRANVNPELELAGFLVTMFNKSLAIHVKYREMLVNAYGSRVFETVFPLAKDFKEAVASRLPVAAYKPKSAAAKAVRAVADELLQRIETRTEAEVLEEAR
ncbi:MAG: ParA family protein [Parafilimonas terrae]|nr:ParA family protein [Parafilimonas terrae]